MKILEKMYNGFLNFFGDLKVYKFPMFIVYDPGSYLIKGEDCREVMKVVQPGDILIRGYVNYLDGYFIPGFFSHAGLYVGEVKEQDIENVPSTGRSRFRSGEQMVVHSMAEGVFMEDVLNFCRCDYMVVLRRDPLQETEADKKIEFPRVFKNALSHLGCDYDFKFDFSDFNKLSCTEFVYVCYQDLLDIYGVKIREEQLLFMKKQIIAPDDFVKSKLSMVWKSKSIPDKQLKKLRRKNLI